MAPDPSDILLPPRRRQVVVSSGAPTSWNLDFLLIPARPALFIAVFGRVSRCVFSLSVRDSVVTISTSREILSFAPNCAFVYGGKLPIQVNARRLESEQS